MLIMIRTLQDLKYLGKGSGSSSQITEKLVRRERELAAGKRKRIAKDTNTG